MSGNISNTDTTNPIIDNSSNRLNILRNEDDNTKWVPNSQYWKEVYSLYANALDASGINLKDPIYANISRISRTGKRMTADPPYVGKTFIFMTRPDLNFGGESDDKRRGGDSGLWNCRTVGLFDYMSRLEIGKQIMPFLMYPNNWPCSDSDFGPLDGENRKKQFMRDKINGMLIEPQYMHYTPFIPLVSNTCVATGGGKDVNLEVYETEGDFAGNRQIYASGVDETFGPGELTLTFNDLYGSPMLHMINLWVMYMHYAAKGICVPRTSYIKTRTIDYTCSIYVFMLDLDGTTIVRWAKYTGCFPRAIPLGEIQHSMDLSPDVLKNFAVSFTYNKYEPMKPLTFLDFNYLGMLTLDHLQQKENSPHENWRETNISLSPEPLIVPEVAKEDVANWADYHAPKTIGSYDNPSDTTERYRNKDDYDQIHWGRCPLVIDQQLVWY